MLNSTHGPIQIGNLSTLTGASIVAPTNPRKDSKFTVRGDLTITDGDIDLNGVSLKQMLEKIAERLHILVPDPQKLEKFEALKNAYDHYKLMEKLCLEDKKD